VLIKFRTRLLQLNSFQISTLTIWALVMVSIPIVDWSAGWSTMIGPINVGVSVTAALVIALLWGAWGGAATLRVGLSILVLSWAAELMGSRKGILFGAYSYTDLLQPQILGVPMQIPLGWLMMMPPSWAVSGAIAGWIKAPWKLPAFIGLSALSMTAWDLFLDPLMVTWGMWVWHHPGGYFGIPWTNYLGWLLVSALITILIRPQKLPVAPLMIIYTAIWLLKSAGLSIFWGLSSPGMIGCLVMGGITISAWRAFFDMD
jgi:putative membrane protein